MTTQTKREITLTRTFDAPRQLVWDAYTIPEQLARWWGPRIMRTPLESIAVDLRPGGVFRYTMVSQIDGTEYPAEMTFRDVVPIERLVYEWEPQGETIGAGELTITLREEDGRTHLTHHYAAELGAEMFPLVEQGTGEQLDRLVELLRG